MEKLAGSSKVNQRVIALALLLGLGSGIGWVAPAMAEKCMKSAEEPIDIKLNQTLNTRSMHYGDPFEGVLTEDYRLGERVLPSGTVLKGKVQGGHASMILGMPGYVSLDIQEAMLPSGEQYHFEQDGEGLKTKKYHNPKAHTGKQVLLAAIPFSAVSALDAVPLKYAAGMGFWQITPISFAARMALGVGLEMSGKNKNSPANGRPVQTRVGYGMLRGTGLTGAYRMVTTAPEPDLKEGAVVSVSMPEKHMNKLFEAGNTVKTVQAEPIIEPKPVAGAADLEALEPVEVETQSFESVHGTLPGSATNASTQPISSEATTTKPAQ